MKMKPNRSLKIVLLSVVTIVALGLISNRQMVAMEAISPGKEEVAAANDAFNAVSVVTELEKLCTEQKKADRPNNPFAIVSEQCAALTAVKLAQCINTAKESQELYDTLISTFVSKLHQDLYKKTDDEKKATFNQKRFSFDENTKQLLEAEYDRQNNWQLKNIFLSAQDSNPNQIDLHRVLRAQVTPDCLSDRLYQLLFTMDATLDAQYVKELKGHTDFVCSVAWSPDGKHALTGSWDNTAKIWDAETGVCKHTLKEHTGFINSVAWSPDGKHALTGSIDNTAKIWDAKTCVCKHTLKGHTGPVYSVAWSPDGNHVLTGSADNTAKLWDVARFIEDRQVEIRHLSLEQLMLLNYLDQLIQQKVATVPEKLRSMVQDLPAGIQVKLRTKITLQEVELIQSANGWYESCAIL